MAMPRKFNKTNIKTETSYYIIVLITHHQTFIVEGACKRHKISIQVHSLVVKETDDDVNNEKEAKNKKSDVEIDITDKNVWKIDQIIDTNLNACKYKYI